MLKAPYFVVGFSSIFTTSLQGLFHKSGMGYLPCGYIIIDIIIQMVVGKLGAGINFVEVKQIHFSRLKYRKEISMRIFMAKKKLRF